MLSMPKFSTYKNQCRPTVVHANILKHMLINILCKEKRRGRSAESSASEINYGRDGVMMDCSRMYT